MKTQNSVSQKIRILHKINKKGYFKQKYQASEKYVHFYALNTWLGLLLHELLNQCGVAAISLWHCSGVMEAQVALIAAFRSSALLSLVSLIFLLTIAHIFSMGFRSGEFAGQSSTVTPWSLNQLLGTFGSVGRCQVLLENEISISIKLVSRKKHEVL